MKARLLSIREIVDNLCYWILIILIAALGFYLVCPKYHFQTMGIGVIKFNKITGTWKVYTLDGKDMLKPEPEKKKSRYKFDRKRGLLKY